MIGDTISVIIKQLNADDAGWMLISKPVPNINRALTVLWSPGRCNVVNRWQPPTSVGVVFIAPLRWVSILPSPSLYGCIHSPERAGIVDDGIQGEPGISFWNQQQAAGFMKV